MISEGSCDTEDWSNDGEQLALHQKLHLKNIFKKEAIRRYAKHNIVVTTLFDKSTIHGLE